MRYLPEITVLMSVRNGSKYIKEAIDSVLRQSFVNFEFLIIDDGSTDNTVDIIHSYNDPRIHLEKCKPDYIRNLNEGLAIAKGKFIARMDADDVMHSERLRIQLKRMQKNPEITVCSTWAKMFSDDGKQRPSFHMGDGIIENPGLQLLRANIILHPTVMMSKSFLLEHNIKYKDYPCVEDYKLWFDIACAGGTLFIEPQDLLFLRVSETQVTSVKKNEMRAESILLRKEMLRYLISCNSLSNLNDLYITLEKLESNELIVSEETFRIFFIILNRIK